MKNVNRPQVPDKNVKLNQNKPRPEIRDNLDHREGEEQDFKGDDVTHNKKEHHRPRRGSSRDSRGSSRDKPPGKK